LGRMKKPKLTGSHTDISTRVQCQTQFRTESRINRASRKSLQFKSIRLQKFLSFFW
jgi:hypothetical protein